MVLVTTALSATPTLGVVGPFSRSDYASDIGICRRIFINFY